eukprot:4878232-Alexandrium_andersonii.AAC.1
MPGQTAPLQAATAAAASGKGAAATAADAADATANDAKEADTRRPAPSAAPKLPADERDGRN